MKKEVRERLSQDKKKPKQPQKKQESKKASGLVNANQFFETGEELGARQQEAERRSQSEAQRQKGQQSPKNPEGPG